MSLDEMIKKRQQTFRSSKPRRGPRNGPRNQNVVQNVKPANLQGKPLDNFRSQRRAVRRPRGQRHNIQIGSNVRPARNGSRLVIRRRLGARREEPRSRTKLRIENLPKQCSNEDLRVLD